MRKLVALCVILSAVSVRAETTVTVNVSPVVDRTGPLVTSVFDSKKTWLKKVTLGKKVELPEGDDQTVTFELQLPAGKYAVHVFQDLDKNGKMKTNFIGIPREPTGVSNDAKGKFGPPKFAKAAFQVGEEPLSINITLAEL